MARVNIQPFSDTPHWVEVDHEAMRRIFEAAMNRLNMDNENKMQRGSSPDLDHYKHDIVVESTPYGQEEAGFSALFRQAGETTHVPER